MGVTGYFNIIKWDRHSKKVKKHSFRFQELLATPFKLEELLIRYEDLFQLKTMINNMSS